MVWRQLTAEVLGRAATGALCASDITAVVTTTINDAVDAAAFLYTALGTMFGCFEKALNEALGPGLLSATLIAAVAWLVTGVLTAANGQLYFVWSGWPGTTDQGVQNLYIASMSDPLTLSGSRSMISTPTFAWEKNGQLVNEGPEALIHNGTLSIIYSASGYWTQDYALGRLTYDGTGSLLDAANWAKAPSPVFAKTNEIVGVGHASFVQGMATIGDKMVILLDVDHLLDELADDGAAA